MSALRNVAHSRSLRIRSVGSNLFGLNCLWCSEFAAFDAAAYSSVLKENCLVDDAIDRVSCNSGVSEAMIILGNGQFGFDGSRPVLA